MYEDRIRILEMLVQGKLTVEEAEYLLESISENSAKKADPKGLVQNPAEIAKKANPVESAAKAIASRDSRKISKADA